MVPAIGGEVELALHDARATGRVDDPARRQRRLLVELLEGHAVRVAAELDLAHASALLDVHSERAGARRELVLEQATIELEVVVRRVYRRPISTRLVMSSLPLAVGK